MAEVTIVVCDRCGQLDRSTSRYRIAKGAHSAFFDLCAEHAEPVEAVLATKSHLFTSQPAAAPDPAPRGEGPEQHATRPLSVVQPPVD